MIKVKNNLVGQTFGKLKVIEQAEDYVWGEKHFAQWLCECSCSEHNKIIVRADSLRNGRTTSCGCVHKEMLIEKNKDGRKKNKYSDILTDKHGDYNIGFASNTGNEFYVDASDLQLINNYCWAEIVDNKGYHYLATSLPDSRETIKMYWIICGKNMDHADRNALNNRRYNLREANSSQQNINQSRQSNNTSGFIGVYFNKSNNNWQAAIGVNKKWIYLGYFNNKENAIKARLHAELKYFGKEFAPQRDLFEKYGITEEDEK